jgi:hypothetical protein
MEDQNRGRVGYVDSERRKLYDHVEELRARQHRLCEEMARLRADLDRLLEVNTQQIAICDRFIAEADDDAEARHYLEQFKASLMGSRMSIESMRQEVNNL